jgi:hypothetical protein
MDATYELWDFGTGNAMAWFSALEEGLEAVRQLLDAYGRDYAQDLDLSQRAGDGSPTTVAAGDQLIEMLDQQTLKQVARP